MKTSESMNRRTPTVPKNKINPRCLGSANQNKTMHMNPPKIGVLVALASAIAALCLPLATRASSEAFTTLYSFTGGIDGANPIGVIQGSDGNFYGTTTIYSIVSRKGTVFRMTPAGTLTTLHAFTGVFGSDGANPKAGLIQGSDGDFYGTTYEGGVETNLCNFGCGTVFQVTPTGTLTTLHSFTGGFVGDGASPYGGLIQGSDGNFYGTTTGHGANINGNDFGTVFQLTPTGTLTTLYAFGTLPFTSDGYVPEGGLIQGSDGKFYGTTTGGGVVQTCSGGCGTVFQLTVVPRPQLPPTGALITLHSFSGDSVNGVTDGAYPEAGLIQGSDGNFYGTTSSGRDFGCGGCGWGTVFQVTPTGTLTTLYAFSGRTDGANPVAGLIQGSDGKFYGTTLEGGAFQNAGTVFQLTVVTSPPLPPTATLITLHAFSGTDGASPYGGVTQASDGELYGTTLNGGANNVGTVFRLEPRLLHAVVSRKIHGSAGTFDVDLPLTGPRGIECRSGGATNDYTMIFTFANALTNVGGASVTGHDPAAGSGTVSSSGIDSSDAHNYIVNLTGVTNAQYITVTLTNLTDSAGNSIPSVPGPSMGVLLGDVNASGIVTSGDTNLCKAQALQPVTTANFRNDINASGAITTGDVNIIKQNALTQLPSPP